MEKQLKDIQPLFMERNLNTIIQGDCLEIMRSMPDKCVDLVLTDPPYGIGMAKQLYAQKPSRPSTYDRSKIKYQTENWDDVKISKEYFDEIFRISKNQIIWGGNYYAPFLPVSRGWLFWDKMFENTNNLSHGELAWTSKDMRLQKWTQSSKAETRGGKDRVHPTQKTVGLFKWCLELFPEAQTIFDPFMGSGTTLVASKHLGKNAIGIEISEKYCKIAQERLDKTTNTLF